ncbi:MAG: methyltransferase [Limnobacter sp.]|uniref:methyltransferase n=2 Tax=Pseudomonadota TaxID=1224 RepID=UPI00391ADE21
MTLSNPATAQLPAPLHSHRLEWKEGADTLQALWLTERQVSAPKAVLLGDDTLNADVALRAIMAGTVILYRGDFHNGRQLVQALARRLDRKKGSRKAKSPELTPAHAFHLHRQSQAQRARVLNAVLVPLNADFSVPLRRAPEVREAVGQAWGDVRWPGLACVSVRELQGLIGAHEWRKKGVEIPALGPTDNRVFPFYGVYSPVRGEYLDLIAQAQLPDALLKPGGVAADVGTGTGVIAAVLARRGVFRVLATETDPRAVACAEQNIGQLGLKSTVQVQQRDLWPDEPVDLLVCNPPWLPAKPTSPIERAIYDDNSAMLGAFLKGARQHLKPEGRVWLVMSDLAVHLGLRKPGELEQLFSQTGWVVEDQLTIKPQHSKTLDTQDPLHVARRQEITSLWCLQPAG